MNSRKTVLIAEDNPGIVDLVTYILDDAGIDTVSVTNGGEAAGKAKIVRPDLIILDVMMPEKEGWEVAGELLGCPETADIPIIFLTARARTEEQLRGWEMPIFEYITKPFDIEDLLSKVLVVLSTAPARLSVLREQLKNEKLRQILGLQGT